MTRRLAVTWLLTAVVLAAGCGVAYPVVVAVASVAAQFQGIGR